MILVYPPKYLSFNMQCSHRLPTPGEPGDPQQGIIYKDPHGGCKRQLHKSWVFLISSQSQSVTGKGQARNLNFGVRETTIPLGLGCDSWINRIFSSSTQKYQVTSFQIKPSLGGEGNTIMNWKVFFLGLQSDFFFFYELVATSPSLSLWQLLSRPHNAAYMY